MNEPAPEIVVAVELPYPAGKREFLDRITAEKRLEEFIRLREELKEHGIPKDEAWRVAGAQFPPMTGEPMEYLPTADTVGWIEKWGLQNTWGNFTAAEAAKAVEEIKKEVTPKKITVPIGHLATRSKKLQKSADDFTKLAALADPAKISPELEVIRWVFNNAKTPIESIDPDGVPGVGSVALLEHVRSSPTNYADFIKTAWIKLIPDKKQLEYESSLSDDGRKQLELCDAFDDEFDDIEEDVEQVAAGEVVEA